MTTELQEKNPATAQPNSEGAQQVFRPHVDIVEVADALTIVADLPGAQADTIDIHFEDGLLTLQGRVAPRYPAEGKVLLREYGVGSFFRTFRVSEQVDAQAISAEYRDGVLRVTLPKAEAAKPRKIAVQAT